MRSASRTGSLADIEQIVEGKAGTSVVAEPAKEDLT